jgi:5'-nucleotidase
LIRILHTNDLHGQLLGAKLAKLQELRGEADLFFDSGDAIKTGNLGIPLRPEAVWGHFSELRCTVSTLGNRESHVLEYGLKAKLMGANHPLVCGNWTDRGGKLVFPGTFETTVNSVKIGVIAAMVPMVTSRMRTQAASAYLWRPPLETLREDAARLRPNVDLLIALTHIGHRSDVELAQNNPGIDVILGGHSHTVIQTPDRYGSTYLCQGGSHGRYAGVYRWDGSLSGGLISLT